MGSCTELPWDRIISMNYKAVTVLCRWISNTVVSFHKTEKMNPTPITFKVRSIALSKSRAPGACSDPTQAKSVWEWDWVDVWGVDRVPLSWPDYALHRMSSHNKGFIITSWRVAAVWEPHTAVSSARHPENCVPALMGLTTAQPVCVSLSPLAHKAASVSETAASHRPRLHRSPPHLWLLFLQVQLQLCAKTLTDWTQYRLDTAVKMLQQVQMFLWKDAWCWV